MEQNHELRCEYKQFLIDHFVVNGIHVKVYIAETKKAVKRYCKDIDMPFREGLGRLYGW